MKEQFENILRATATLSDNNKAYIVKQLKQINNEHINKLSKLDKVQARLDGVKKEERTDYLTLAIDILKLHGYNLAEFISYDNEFLDWFIEKTNGLKKYQPKEITYNILNSFYSAFNLYQLEFGKIPDTYNDLKEFMLTWDDVLSERQANKLKTVLHG